MNVAVEQPGQPDKLLLDTVAEELAVGVVMLLHCKHRLYIYTVGKREGLMLDVG